MSNAEVKTTVSLEITDADKNRIKTLADKLLDLIVDHELSALGEVVVNDEYLKTVGIIFDSLSAVKMSFLSHLKEFGIEYAGTDRVPR